MSPDSGCYGVPRRFRRGFGFAMRQPRFFIAARKSYLRKRLAPTGAHLQALP
jgi:hypothetical protein